jgi:hypothetical protein
VKKILLLAAVAALTACSPEIRDSEDADLRDPDEIVIFTNVDTYPNLVKLCVDGLGFVTTTREYDPWGRVPEWDDYCATKDTP